MIYLDRREGSKDLLPLFPPGLATLTTLPYCDATWYGIGPGGAQVVVGVERKRVTDLLACIKDGRFSGHQLPGMYELCQYAYLVVEGHVRPCPETGVLQHDAYGRGAWQTARLGASVWMYDAWEHHLETLRWKTPLRVVSTRTPAHTARWVTSAYTWWTVGGGWDGHTSHTAVHIPPDPSIRLVQEPLYRRTVTKVAQQLPGVRDVIADRVHDRFLTVAELVQAGPAEWATVEGLGPIKIKRILEAINGPVAIVHPAPAPIVKPQTQPQPRKQRTQTTI